VSAFVAANRDRLPQGGDQGQLMRRVREYLQTQRFAEQRQAFLRGLRDRGDVSVYLEPSAAGRVAVSTDHGFVRGAADAPVTIVEFSDFQCPYCKAATATMKQLVEKYPGKVKWVFLDFPIRPLHPDSPRAHQAARCAGEQGKFWEYHDLLFEKSPHHTTTDLASYAKDLQLEAKAFTTCLESPKPQAEIDRTLQEGSRLGVTGTPSFFINGRPVLGAQPAAAFQRIVESELARTASR
jgi:protein-disulfide isomerase